MNLNNTPQFFKQEKKTEPPKHKGLEVKDLESLFKDESIISEASDCTE